MMALPRFTEPWSWTPFQLGGKRDVATRVEDERRAPPPMVAEAEAPASGRRLWSVHEREAHAFGEYVHIHAACEGSTCSSGVRGHGSRL